MKGEPVLKKGLNMNNETKKAHKVLVVDDEIPIQRIVKFNLEKEGYIVFLADNGKKAVESVKQNAPDIILLDVMMPEMDGYEVCKALKKNEKTKHIPVIMLTARGQEADEQKGLAVGADDYITKPFSPKKLMELVKEKLKA